MLLVLYYGQPDPSLDPDETDSEEELAAERLTELHTADKELGSVARPQPKPVRRERRRSRTEPAAVREPVRTRLGREVKRPRRLGI